MACTEEEIDASSARHAVHRGLVALGNGASAAADGGGVQTVRFATFNASLNRNFPGQLLADLSTTGNAQAKAVAEIVQRTRPDVLLVNEFDYEPAALALFQDNYLSLSQNGADPISFPPRFIAPSNTGVASGFDLDKSGSVGGPNDAWGFGFFPGQFGMAVYSKYPIDTERARTFQHSGRTCRSAPPGQPRDACPGRLVLAGRAGGVPALVQEPLGSPDQNRRQVGALPRQPPDPASFRRA